MLHTLTFCYVSPVTRDTVPLIEANGDDVTLRVEAENKSDTFYHTAVVDFCKAQGNDCRVRTVT